MPAFDVTIEHRVIEYLIVTVEADTATQAEEQVQAVINACYGDSDAIAEHYGNDKEYPEIWEAEEESIGVEFVEQLDRV